MPPYRFLAEVLRYDLGLTGTKIGCNEAECGACTVLVNGQQRRLLHLSGLQGPGRRDAHHRRAGRDSGSSRRISQQPRRMTAGDLHPLQEAFVVHGATQCGFCTPGFILQAKTLLDENADPSDDDIKHCLKDTYCRCTGYTSIISAVQAAAAEDAHRRTARPRRCRRRRRRWSRSASRWPGPMPWTR